MSKLIESYGSFLQFNMAMDEFGKFIGLSSREEYIECGSNRSYFTSLVSTFLSLLKRSSHVQQEGMYHLIHPFFPSFVSLTRCLNKIWIPDLETKSWDPVIIFSKITFPDKGCLLEGFCLPRQENDVKSEALKCQSYLWALHESLFSLLATFLLTFGSTILINSSFNLLSNIFEDVQILPPMKLRMILKVFVKPVSCRWMEDPEFRQHFILPLFQDLIPCVFHQCDIAWVSFRSTDWKEYEQIQDEIVDEQMNRLLSRELMEVMKGILVQEKRSTVGSNVLVESDEMTDASTNNSQQKSSISELGKFLLNHNLNQIVCMTVSSLSWIDSNVLFKSLIINQVLLEFLIENRLIQSKEEISFYIHHLLTGLSFMSEDEQNQPAILTLCLTLYRHAKSLNSEYLFCSAPLSSMTDSCKWQGLDSTLRKLDQGKKTAGMERKKRDALKSVLAPLIGVSSDWSE